MSTDEKLRIILSRVLRIDESSISEVTALGICPEWDSLRHLSLILTLEEEFNLSIPDEEVQVLVSYSIIREWLEENV
jgi:acyl carrier protein